MSDERALNGRVAVVTGGSGGIGSAICRRLASAGARVVLTYRQNENAAQAVLAGLEGSGHTIARAQVDDSAALQRLADQVAEKYRKVDLLVNNAGVTRPVPHDNLDDLDDDLIDQIFRVNWRGAFAATRAFKNLLMSGDGGLIVNISSVAAVTGLGSNVAYCASKAALDSMTRSLARALAPKIRVVSVAPGWVEGEYAKRMAPAIIAEQKLKTPLERIARAEDVADAVLAVATLLTFSTGCIIPVDGGRPLG
ncbi:MAG: SDR family oxidoreductase [Chloroflexota bacterium]